MKKCAQAIIVEFKKKVSNKNVKPIAELAFLIKPPCEKTGLRGFRPGPTQTRLHNQRRWRYA